jgi:hypothetical protein
MPIFSDVPGIHKVHRLWGPTGRCSADSVSTKMTALSPTLAACTHNAPPCLCSRQTKSAVAVQPPSPTICSSVFSKASAHRCAGTCNRPAAAHHFPDGRRKGAAGGGLASQHTWKVKHQDSLCHTITYTSLGRCLNYIMSYVLVGQSVR